MRNGLQDDVDGALETLEHHTKLRGQHDGRQHALQAHPETRPKLDIEVQHFALAR